MVMKSPLVLVDKIGCKETFLDNLAKAQGAGAKSLLIFACEGDGYADEVVDVALKALTVPVCGGVFPQIIIGDENLTTGSIVCGFFWPFTTCEIQGLSDNSQDFTGQMQTFSDETPLENSLFVFVDGLSGCIAYFLEECYGLFGSHRQYIGGGAGSLSFVPGPSIFTNQGLQQDIAQVVSLPQSMVSCVDHGWTELAGPFLVTGAVDNVIQSLDYRPAYDVYVEAIRTRTGQTVTLENFYDLAKGFPFGLSRIEGKVVVRDPLKVEDGNLICVGEVPANHLVYILKSDVSGLLNASKAAAKSVAASDCIDKKSPVFVFDCVSRVLYLEDRFRSELNGIKQALPDSGEMIGALSLGEIACSGDTCLEFFNKSIVIGVFREQQLNVV